MLETLGFQLTLWLLSAGASVFVFEYFRREQRRVREREARLPEATLFSDLTERVQRLQAAHEDLLRQSEAANALIATGERARADEAAARQWLAQQRDELLRVEAQRQEQEKLKQELDARQAQLSAVEADRRALMEANARLVEESRGIETAVAERRREIEQIDATLDERERRSEVVAQLLRKAEDDLRSLERDVATSLDRAGKAEKDADALEARRDDARRALEDLQLKLAAANADLARVSAECKSQTEYLAALRRMIEDAGKRLDKQNELGGAARAEDRYRDLWEVLPFPTLHPGKRVEDEREHLGRVEQHLHGLGLRFPPRVIHAFHTALKVAEYSPMVVLAGISGTGKSELPRRYAEAMGIHFVGIAVQPRWDSPQDLFGFFNYMEGRYKATDLARAMVQFEKYNRRHWPMPKDWAGARDDRMLLVLLDEMNLARVEYYFSEFLSKLEVRRGIREEDADERAKAEISIDMGSLGKHEHQIAFFPARNVLFAGTMNEDETTQALSDKVLDRACVLRFGRPKRPSQVRPTGGGAQAKAGLTFEAWKGWQRSELSASDARVVGEWISSLNDAMEKIGRPFGHRVAQAMYAYVANYPEFGGNVAERVRRAFADQIEQRVLPKLRGLELDDVRGPMTSIRKVLQDCDDIDLLRAFDEGERNQQIFIWRGLDRTE